MEIRDRPTLTVEDMTAPPVGAFYKIPPINDIEIHDFEGFLLEAERYFIDIYFDGVDPAVTRVGGTFDSLDFTDYFDIGELGYDDAGLLALKHFTCSCFLKWFVVQKVRGATSVFPNSDGGSVIFDTEKFKRCWNRAAMLMNRRDCLYCAF